MKKLSIISIVLSVLMIFTVLPIGVSAETAANDMMYTIWQADPAINKSAVSEGDNVSSSKAPFETEDLFVGYDEEKGYFYRFSSDGTAKQTKAATICRDNNTFPWMAGTGVTPAIATYAQVSVNVRCTPKEDIADQSVKFTLWGGTEYYNTYYKVTMLNQAVVPANGEWQTITVSGINVSADNWWVGLLSFFVDHQNLAFDFDIDDIRIKLKASDKDAINTALSATDYTFDKLISYEPYTFVANDTTHIIWQADPAINRSGSAVEGDIVSANVSFLETEDLYVGYDNNKGLYYTFNSDGTAKQTKAATICRDNNTFSWMANTGVTPAIANYVSVTANVRCTPTEDIQDASVKFTVFAGTNYWNTYNKLTLINQANVPANGEWQTVTVSGIRVSDDNWYTGLLSFFIDHNNLAFDFDVDDIRITLKGSQKEVINAKLASTTYTFDDLISYVPYAFANTPIWYANPERAARVNGSADVKAVLTDWTATNTSWYNYDTNVINDSEGTYYRMNMAVDNNTGGDNYTAVFYTGINSDTVGYGWMNNAEVLNALRPYMYLSYQYRVTANKDMGTTAKFCMRIANENGRSANLLQQPYIKGQGQWYEYPVTGLTNNFDRAWKDGLISINLYDGAGNLNGTQTIDLRNLSISIPSTMRENINAALAEIEGIDTIKNFTAGITLENDANGNPDYYSLLSGAGAGVKYDLTDDGSFNVIDLIRGKKIEAGAIEYVADNIYYRGDGNNDGYLDALDLAIFRQELLNPEVKAEEKCKVYPEVNHPGVVEMDAEYTMLVEDEDGNLLDASDFTFTTNSDFVTVNGSTITVPYVSRISTKELVVTAVSNTDPTVIGTYTFDFQNFSDAPTLYDEFTEDTGVWKTGFHEGTVAGAIEDGNMVLSTDGENRAQMASNGEKAFSQAYGCFSAKYKTSDTAWVNTSIWLCTYGRLVENPADLNQQGGEIDIMEYIPGSRIFAQTVHWNGWADYHQEDSYRFTATDDFVASEYHIYSLVWTTEAYYWYIDGKLTYVHDGDAVGSESTPATIIIGCSPIKGTGYWDEDYVYNQENCVATSYYDWVKVYGLD